MPRPMSKKHSGQQRNEAADLFGNDATGETDKIRINSKFASKYEDIKRKQELSRAKDLGIDLDAMNGHDSEDDESEDEGELLTHDVDKTIMKTLQAIRKRDPKIYDPEAHFFKEEAEDDSSDAESEEKPKHKRMTAKDVLRKQLVEAAESGKADAFADDADDDDPISLKRRVREESRSTKLYDEEQKSLRSAFLKTAANAVSESESSDDGLLKKKVKSKHVKPADDSDDASSVDRNELREYLKSKDKRKIAEHADEIPDPDKFLDAFMKTAAWREEEEDAYSESDVEDENELEKADEFEAKYNFRFEEPGGVAIATHPRVIEDTVRRKETKRKEERERKKERKESERQQAETEMRRLMNVKRAEVKSRVQKIQEVAGNGVNFDKLATIFADELDKDFDPAAYDAKMAALFGDDYYGEAEMDAPPVAAKKKHADSSDEDSEADAPDWIYGDGSRPAWAGPTVDELAQGHDGFEGLFGDRTAAAKGGAAEGGSDDDEDEEDYDPAVSGTRRKKHKRKQKAKKMSDVARLKAVLAEGGKLDDPDEVLALGFEDVIAGGLKTRFHYREVPAADYGLDADEVLLADDNDLNNHVSLKKLAPYREDEWHVPSKKRKRSVKAIREKIVEELQHAGVKLTSGAPGAAADVEEEAEQKEEPEEIEGAEAAEKKKRKKHRKHKKASKHAGDSDDDSHGAAAEADGAGAVPEPARKVAEVESKAEKSGHKRKRSKHDGKDKASTTEPEGKIKKSRLDTYAL